MNYNLKEFKAYNDHEEKIIKSFDTALTALREQPALKSLYFLVSGDHGTGKTELASYLAAHSGAKQIKIVRPEKLLALPLERQLSFLDDVFLNARRAEFSVIILDDFESLLGADAELRTYSNMLRIKFDALLKEEAASGKKCILIATTKSPEFIKRVELHDLFNEYALLQNIQLCAENARSIVGNLLISQGMKADFADGPDIVMADNVSVSVRELVYKLQKFSGIEHSDKFDLNKFLSTAGWVRENQQVVTHSGAMLFNRR